MTICNRYEPINLWSGLFCCIFAPFRLLVIKANFGDEKGILVCFCRGSPSHIAGHRSLPELFHDQKTFDGAFRWWGLSWIEIFKVMIAGLLLIRVWVWVVVWARIGLISPHFRRSSNWWLLRGSLSRMAWKFGRSIGVVFKVDIWLLGLLSDGTFAALNFSLLLYISSLVEILWINWPLLHGELLALRWLLLAYSTLQFWLTVRPLLILLLLDGVGVILAGCVLLFQLVGLLRLGVLIVVRLELHFLKTAFFGQI